MARTDKGARNEAPEPIIDGRDPTRPFYLAMSIVNLDGSLAGLEGSSEGIEGAFDTERDAINALAELNQEYPSLDGFVFHCVPVARVWRGRTRTTRLKP